MNLLILGELSNKAWGFIKSYYGQISAVLVIVFASLLLRTQGALNQCQAEKSTNKEILSVASSSSQTARVHNVIVYKYLPGQPCPDVTVDTTGEIQHWQSQAVTVTPVLVASKPPQPSNGLWVGLGYLGAPNAQVGLQFNNLAIYAQTTGSVHGGGGAVRVLSW